MKEWEENVFERKHHEDAHRFWEYKLMPTVGVILLTWAYFTNSISLALLGLLLILFSSTDRYTSSKGEKYHIYTDCKTLHHSYNIKKFSYAIDTWILGFDECKVCKERSADELSIKKAKRKEKERQRKIEELQEQIDALENGADPDDLETLEEESDWEYGVPQRYQQ